MELAHRLINTRSGTALLAVLAAAAAVVLVLVYVNRYRSDVNTTAAPVSVLVAQHAIAKGTAGEVILGQSLFRTTQVRSEDAVSGAFIDASALRGKVATRDIARGEQLTSALFAGGISTMSTKLAGTQRAVSVPIDPARGLVGKIEAGDHVDVVASLGAQGSSAGLAHPVVKVLLQDVPVLAVNNQDSGATSSSPTTQNGTVTLRLTDAQAAQVVYASDNGNLWFVLRPRAGAPRANATIVDLSSLLVPAGGGK